MSTRDPMGRRGSHWLVAGVGLLLGLAATLSMLRSADLDPYVFTAIGEQAVPLATIEEVAGREVTTRPALGHDGQHFLLLSWDPWITDTQYVSQLDAPMYRAQRLAFPVMLGFGGLLPKTAAVWMFPVIQTLALALGTAGTAKLARQHGLSVWWGLSFAINPGLLAAVQIGGAGIVAMAAAVWATVALDKGRVGQAAAFMTLSVMSRETMFAFLGGLCLVQLHRTRRIPWRLGLPPTLAFAAWMAYLATRLPLSGYLTEEPALTYPFGGILGALPDWSGYGADKLIPIAATLVCIVVLAALLPRYANTHIGAGSAMFVLVSFVMGTVVWRQPFDASRGVAPVFIGAALLAAMERTRRERSSVRLPAELAPE